MFSKRLKWSLEPNPITALLEKKRAQGTAILDLTQGNPTRCGFAYPASELLAAFPDPRSIRYEPSPAGLLEARVAIAAYYGGQIDPERILLTASTSEAYAYLFKLLADPGEEILVPRPSYPLFEFLAGLEAATVVPYRLEYDHGWFIDFEYLRDQLTPRTRAIVTVSPNNPTGSFLKRDELHRLCELCAARRIALISDEVFSDYSFAPDPDRVASLAGMDTVLAFALSGLSKVAGLPQVKLGWMVINGPEALRREALNRLELIADTYLSVGTPVQWAAGRLLSTRHAIQDQIRERVRANLDELQRQVTFATVLQVEGGWYATLRVPRVRSEEEWVLQLLEKENALVQPGFFFDFETEAFLVVSLLTDPGTFSAGIERLCRFDAGSGL